MGSKSYTYLDRNGTFRMPHPESSSYLYFPIAGESGMKSCVTPLLGGDSKLDQNTFLLQPVSVEELHNLKSTRNFWCRMQDGRVWSATGGSAETEALRGTELEEETELEAGIMWHRMKRYSRRYPLASTITSFVPTGLEPAEIMEVTIRNTGSETLTLTPIAAIPLYCRSADNIRDHRHVTSLLHRIRVNEGGIQVTPTLTFDERGHKKNTLTYYVYGADAQGKLPRDCCPMTETFLGEGGSYARPEGVYGDKGNIWVRAGEETAGAEAVAALRFDEIRLAPGQQETYIIIMGITPREQAEKMRQQVLSAWGTREGVERELETVKQKWLSQVNVHYSSADPDWDNFMYWVSFQPILRRIYGCSFLPYHDYGKGGRGWRDLWQDCLALLIMEPKGVREKLLDYYGGVRMDGTNATIIGAKQGEFVADRNNIVRVWMDHGFWPFQTTELYIQQTGDLDILLERAGYFKDAQIFRGERKDTKWQEDQGIRQLDEEGNVVRGTVLEHILLQNVTAFYDVGCHNHIRLRGADWNDAMDMARENGESVAFTAAYAGSLRQIGELLRKMVQIHPERRTASIHKEVAWLLEDRREIYDSVEKKQALLSAYYEKCAHRVRGEEKEVPILTLADTLEGMADWICGHIRDTEWMQTPDGSFYNGYYDDHCRRLEGSFPQGTRMGLTAQVFPIMFGTALDDQVEQIIRSADKLLYHQELGGYRLNTDLGEVKDDMGRAFGFAYGHKENGAVFSHMSVMYANALYRRGFVEAGFRALDALYRQSVDFEKSRIYPGLPEYFGPTGRGMYAYLTGSASWLMMTVVTQMYGVRGYYGDLVIAPKLMDSQLGEDGKMGLRLQFAGADLEIQYETANRRPIYTEAREVWLDGRKMAECRIPREMLTVGEVHEILVKL